MKAPFTLVHDAEASCDTVLALEHLLDEARKGRIIGVAYVAMLKHRRYVVHAAGEAHRNPTFARGMLATLDDSLSRRILT